MNRQSLRQVELQHIVVRITPVLFAALLWVLVFKTSVAAPKSATSKVPVGNQQATQQLDEARRLGVASRDALKAIEDYTATFLKIERIGGAVIEQKMDLKLRRSPFSVYLRFRSPNELGREVIYVAGANDGRLLAHQPGVLGALAGTHRLKIDEWPVTLENRYPITEIGIERMLERSIAAWNAIEQSRFKSGRIRVIQDAEIDGLDCQVVEVEYERKKSKGEVSLSRVYFAKESQLPIRAEQFGWPVKTGVKPPLLEIYSYRNLNPNVGLADADFDPGSPEYGFSKGVLP